MGKQRTIEHVNNMRRPDLPYDAKQLVTVSIPPLADQSILIAGYDHFDGSLRILDVGALRELQVLAEQANSLRKLDSRDTITATIAAASAVGTQASAKLTVPAGEVWFIGAINVTSPAESGPGVGDIVQVNFRISRWVDQSATPSVDGQLFWAANQGTLALDLFTAWFAGQEGLVWSPFGDGVPTPCLRLTGGDYITLVATLTGAVAGAALAATLTTYGYGGKALLND